MLARLLAHLRNQWMGALALFLVLTGGVAYAANTISSADIINGEVKTADISDTDGVRSVDVRNDNLAGGGLAGRDLATDSVGASEIAPDAVGTSEIQTNGVGLSEVAANSITKDEVADNSLGGGDINESALSGLGANDGFDGFCDPASTTFLDCAEGAVTVSLSRPMNVLVIATSHFDVFFGAPAWGNCRLERNNVPVSNDHPIGALTQDTSQTVHQGGMNLVDVESLGAGTYTFQVSCNEQDPDVEYRDIRVAVVKLSQE